MMAMVISIDDQIIAVLTASVHLLKYGFCNNKNFEAFRVIQNHTISEGVRLLHVRITSINCAPSVIVG